VVKNLTVQEFWSDLHHAIKTDGTGAIKKVVNVDSVNTSIDNILRTKQGERVMLPEFASNLHGFLFDPINKSLQYRLAKSIKDVIERWDDRVEVRGVDYFADIDRSTVKLHITCRIRGYSETFIYKIDVPTVS